MRHKDTVFYRGRTAVSMDFSAGEVSTDGAVLLLEKLERKHSILQYFSQVIPDRRDPLRIVHPIEKLLKQRVFTMVQGYEDANDVQYLKNDPLLKDILEGELASQPMAITASSCTTNCFSMMAIRVRSSSLYCARGTATPTNGTLPF